MERYEGLSSREAAELLAEHGENAIKEKRRSGALAMFAGQFRDALMMILLAATAASAAMGEISEALTIIAIVFLNAVLGFLQEYRTERTLEKLGELSAPTAEVIRDGARRQIPARELVPGDIALVEAGDRIPADGLVLESAVMCCDESMLTGESDGVEKVPSTPERPCKVYMGSLVTKGRGVIQVTGTGGSTEMGRIAGMLGSIEVGQTPLQKRLAQLSKVIGLGCLVVCAVVAATGILRGEPPFEMLLTGVSLSVAAVPEGLPAIVTIALAMSVGRMVKRNALVRRLHAVETLGCATVICSDKTGTLTENRMTVQELRTPEQIIRLRYQRKGDSFFCGENPVSVRDHTGLRMMLTVAAVCSSAVLTTKKGVDGGIRNQASGEPTEAALLLAAARGGVTREKLGWEVLREQPFDSARKRMTVCAKGPDGTLRVLTKGAPDVLLERCTRYLTQKGEQTLTKEKKDKILAQVAEMGESALRVLAFAWRPAAGPADVQERDFIFLGLAGLMDPPRQEAFEAVRKCRRAHIRPIMITGDHGVTARAIAQQLKICREGDLVVTGAQLDQWDDRRLKDQLDRVAVFARVTPAHKLRIVRALKEQGNIVAMTGDGVNDAPAIKEADIGVAMGKGGTDVTKEAASVILLDDNFATLVAAVEEGRIIYGNIRKFIRYLLSCNIGEVVTMFFAMLMGMPVPLLPIQILLINLVTDGLPAIALGLEPGEPEVMSRPPRQPDESIFSHGLGATILLRGILIGLTTLGVFGWMLRQGAPLEAARTGALLTLILTQLIHVFECRSETRSLFAVPLSSNPKLVGAVTVSASVAAAAVWWAPAREIFLTAALSGQQLQLIILCCAIVPVISGLVLALRSGKSRRLEE